MKNMSRVKFCSLLCFLSSTNVIHLFIFPQLFFLSLFCVSDNIKRREKKIYVNWIKWKTFSFRLFLFLSAKVHNALSPHLVSFNFVFTSLLQLEKKTLIVVDRKLNFCYIKNIKRKSNFGWAMNLIKIRRKKNWSFTHAQWLMNFFSATTKWNFFSHKINRHFWFPRRREMKENLQKKSQQHRKHIKEKKNCGSKLKTCEWVWFNLDFIELFFLLVFLQEF